MPVNEFLGLSTAAMHHLVYDTFGEKSPVRLRDDIGDETLDQIPLFRILEEYLKIIQRDKHIKLTPLGALPKKVLVELYDKKFLLDEFIEEGIVKVWREENVISIRSARMTAEMAGLVRKVAGKLTLTKAATKLLDTNNRLQLFKQFFQAFTKKFFWGFNDWYPEVPIGQIGWAFSVLMLDKFGDEARTLNFYGEKYLKVFPSFVSFFEPSYATAEKQLIQCYGLRTFERFLLWFGFVTIYTRSILLDPDTDIIKRTDLVKSVFEIDYK